MALTPEQVVHGTAAEYGIVWDAHRGNIVPQEFLGKHPFSEKSRHWAFDFGEGCVGSAYSNQETLVIEDVHTGDSMFMRKSLARSCGINTIAFVPQPDGSVLEIGFERTLDELPKSWWMKNLLESYANSDNYREDLARMRTPSPGFFANNELAPASLRALAQVAVSINQSLALLQASSPPMQETGASSASSRSSSSKEADQWELDDTPIPPMCEEDWELDDFPIPPMCEEDFSDVMWELDNMPKPLVRLDLAKHVPLPVQRPRNNSKPKANGTSHDAVMPQYDAYEPNYLRFLQSVCSVGSVGHPYSCGGACKYMKTQRGCKIGADCDRCHLCLWTRSGERELEKTRKHYSAGSVGHPRFCGGACKYHTRKECKAGKDCDRCHICTWTRSGERNLVRRKQQYQDESIGQPTACGGCPYCVQERQGSICNHLHLSF